METKQQTHPQWWTPTYDSAWERGKAAFRRDWEQTKRDLTGGGRELNQDAGDTLRQARGISDVPPVSVPNVPDDNDVKRTSRAAEDAEAVANERAKAYGPSGTIKKQAKAKDARATANTARSESDRNIDLRWDDAEIAFQYGFGAGMHFVPDWDEKAKVDLRTEWNMLHPDRPWSEVEALVHKGWDRARAEKRA